MADDQKPKNESQKPQLNDLVAAATPTGKQKFMNFFGLGYGGNTAVSVSSVKLARKFFPGLLEKWEGRYERKYTARKHAELIDPIADKLDDNARKAIEDKIAEDAKVYAAKTVDSRLLSTGGFAMLPFQSAMQIRDYSTNISPEIETFRASCEARGMKPDEVETALHQELDRQKNALDPKDKKGKAILEGALEEPEFSPLGPAAKKDMPKWTVGRFVALGAAFTTQTIVDDRFSKPKEAVDRVLSKILTRITSPGGYEAKADPNNAFTKSPTDAPEGVNPKIYDVVRMITTDAYMTSVAIGTHMASMSYWDKQMPSHLEKLGGLKDKAFSAGDHLKALQEKLSGPSGPSV